MELYVNDRIKVRRIDFFNSFNIKLQFDSIASTFAFRFYFDPTNKDHAELACVSHYHEAWIEHNGERLLTGYILSNAFNSTSKKEMVEIGGYSKSGILEDCDIPSNQPLEWNGLTLFQIAQKIVSVFKSIKLKVDAPTNNGAFLEFNDISEPVVNEKGEIEKNVDKVLSFFKTDSVQAGVEKEIPKANAEHPQNIKQYLTNLASQRNILLSHDAFGNLVLTEAKTNQVPILDFNLPTGNTIPGTSMHLAFNGQAIHSHITVLGQQDAEGGNAPECTITNPYCPIIYRPKVIQQSSGTDITIQETARQALAAELKSIVLTITTDRWDVDGKIIRPNNVISVLNPECFIYKKTNWFIESVTYAGDSKKLTTTMVCVPVEVYNKMPVKNIFVDPHENLPRF